jgi:hypothetical protein
MINYFQKYSALTLIFSLIYLKFFIVSPFFHHHHHDELTDFKHSVFHSHIFDIEDSKSSSVPGVNFDNAKAGHNHFDQINFQYFTLSQRISLVSQYSINCSIQFNLIDRSDQSVVSNIISPPDIQIKWDKYVQSAANVSPPLV